MLEFAVFAYGMLATFVLSGASRNQRDRRPNPRVLEYVGWLLFGASSAASVFLFVYALRHWPG